MPFGDDGSVLDYLKCCEFAGSTPNVGDLASSIRELSQRREIVQLGRAHRRVGSRPCRWAG